MTSAKFLRQSMCNAISSAVKDDIPVKPQLDEIFHAYFQDNITVYEPNTIYEQEIITPLMMACDKSCLDALLYLKDQLERSKRKQNEDLQQLCIQTKIRAQYMEAWGHPTEESACGNTAAHHAMAAGFSKGLEILEFIWGCIEVSGEEGQPGFTQLDRYLSLLSVTNENGDTPLMMACVYDHANTMKDVLGHSLSIAGDSTTNISMVKTWHQRMYNMKNSQFNSSLKLACMGDDKYGAHVNVVKFLIQPQVVQCGKVEYKLDRLVPITDADVIYCDMMHNVALGYGIESRRKEAMIKQSRECLSLIKREREKISEEATNELLLEREKISEEVTNELLKECDAASTGATESLKPNTNSYKKKNRKKKKRNNKTKQKAQVNNNTSEDDTEIEANIATPHTPWADANDKKKNDPIQKICAEETSITQSPFITLQDGNVVSKGYTPPIQIDSPLDEDNSKETTSDIKQQAEPLESILQSTTNTAVSSADGGYDVAAVMDSLCLDPSMLLLSAHGMAIDMSPCQIEAIESILKHQLKAVNEAQKIQSRLRR